MSQVDQVFYFEDERDQVWACIVKIKPINLNDFGWGEGPHDVCENQYECEALILTSTDYHNPQDDIDYVQLDLDPIQAYVI
jgi:hypothetical protein